MERIQEFIDASLRRSCIHCGALITSSRDHVPSKCLLREPHPVNLPVVGICSDCNNGFAADEEYLFLFLSCVLAGSTDPDSQENPKARRALRHHDKLRRRIELSKTMGKSINGGNQCIWTPETDRIARVVVKNARGHAYYEYAEPILGEPAHVWAVPLESLTVSQREAFENIHGDRTIAGWPEVSSRMMTRVTTGQDLVDGWVIVQDGVYRYGLERCGTILVKSVLYNYLATEVCWNDFPRK